MRPLSNGGVERVIQVPRPLIIQATDDPHLEKVTLPLGRDFHGRNSRVGDATTTRAGCLFAVSRREPSIDRGRSVDRSGGTGSARLVVGAGGWSGDRRCSPVSSTYASAFCNTSTGTCQVGSSVLAVTLLTNSVLVSDHSSALRVPSPPQGEGAVGGQFFGGVVTGMLGGGGFLPRRHLPAAILEN